MMPRPLLGHIMGFDFGEKRIGTALADLETGHTQPLATVTNKNKGPDWSALDKLIETWRPTRLIIGEAGNPESSLRRQAVRFADALKQRYALPVDFAAEQYSSAEAEHRLTQAKAAGLTKKIAKGDVDSAAAALILETWLSCLADETECE